MKGTDMRWSQATACAVIFSILCGSALAQDKVKISMPGFVMPNITIAYAVDRGFMKRAGIDAEILQVERRDLATMAVLSGDAIASISDPVEVATAVDRGADLKVVAGTVTNAAPFLVGDASVTLDQATWKGKTAALITPPNTLYTLFIRELKLGGWQAVEKNIYRKDFGDPPEAYLQVTFGKRGTDLAALFAGRANLAVLHEPDASTAVLRGKKTRLRSFAGDFPQLLWSTLNTSGTAIKEKREVVSKVVRGLNAALADIHAYPDKIIAFAEHVFGKADPQVVQTAMNNLIVAGIFPKDCMITERGWTSNVELISLAEPNSQATRISFAQLADTSFCADAIKGR
jgi:ABC-type nitrate/sulfonate/bicarbonate transport system substrate-binding protein